MLLTTFAPFPVLKSAALHAVQTIWPWMGPGTLQSEDRSRDVVWPRWVYAYLLAEEARMPRAEVADTMGWRQRSNVIHAMESVAMDIKTNRTRRAELARAVLEFRKRIEAEEERLEREAVEA